MSRAVASAMVIIVVAAGQAMAATSGGSSTELTGKVPAVFAFGDSILDTGNNNVVPTIVKSNFPPYGKDFVGCRPTGRFSNGKLPSDLIASAFGIKELLPPYLTTLQENELVTGVCFASAGTGYDLLTSKPLGVLSMVEQLHLFRGYKARLVPIVGQEGADSIVANGVHLLCAGSNDLLNTYTTFRKAHFNVSTYVTLLVASASSFVQELYELGARKIAVVGVPTIGCVPYIRTLLGGQQRSCIVSINQAAMEYNAKLSQEVLQLERNHPGATILCIDVYSALSDIIQRPSAYGFKEVSKGCCGTGLLEASFLCNSLTTTTCSDDTEYVFWDGVHPTQRAYEIIVEKIKERYLRLFL